jgi:hypothetical protein
MCRRELRIKLGFSRNAQAIKENQAFLEMLRRKFVIFSNLFKNTSILGNSTPPALKT